MMTQRPHSTVNMKMAILQRVAPSKWDAAKSSTDLVSYLIGFSKLLEQEDFTALEVMFYLAKQVVGERYGPLKSFLNKKAIPFITSGKLPWNVLRRQVIPEFAQICTTAGSHCRVGTSSWSGRGSISAYYEEIFMYESLGKLHYHDDIIHETAISKMTDKLRSDGWIIAYSELTRARGASGFISRHDMPEIFERIDTEHDISRELNGSSILYRQPAIEIPTAFGNARNYAANEDPEHRVEQQGHRQLRRYDESHWEPTRRNNLGYNSNW